MEKVFGNIIAIITMIVISCTVIYFVWNCIYQSKRKKDLLRMFHDIDNRGR